MKARTQTREVTDAIRVVVTDSVEPNAATNHLGRKMESEAVNVVEPPQQTAVLAQRNVGTVLQTLAGTVLAIAMIVPLTIIPGLIIAVLPLEIYVLGRVYDNVVEIRSRRDDADVTKDLERANEENEEVRVRTYGAHLVF
ncbi:MAG: hypothetical protein AM324_001565 [Candidatus Thorarchaeota archaeon SMTZ1-83]|nr:MAG: hypothetical protein AM324_02470 [Candidatus Thorarchaeota archaeon SMTZ1-83]